MVSLLPELISKLSRQHLGVLKFLSYPFKRPTYNMVRHSQNNLTATGDELIVFA